MRVLYVTQGDSAHDRRFLDAMCAADLEVGVFRLTGAAVRQPLPPRLQDFSLPPEATDHRPGRTVRLARQLRGTFRTFRPSVVHAGPIQQGAFLAAMTGARPLVSMSWGSDLLQGARGGLGRWQATYALSRSEVLLCDCQAVRLKAIELGMPEDRVVVFPWGVDLERFRPAGSSRIRRRLEWMDAFVLLSSRSLEPIYGVDVVVDAFLATATQDRRLRLLLLADGSQRPIFQERIAAAGMQSRVHFAGVLPEADLADYYHAADLYLSASHSDGSSVSLLEAMACGLPVIVSDLPSNREWVGDDVNGWVFPDGDRHALAAGIRRASQQLGELARMGRQGRAKVEAQADWRRNSRMLLDAYQMARSRARA